MPDTPKNVTCPECKKDAPENDFAENGRCPSCGFNYQLYRDNQRLQAVIAREKDEEEKEKQRSRPAAKKNRLW